MAKEKQRKHNPKAGRSRAETYDPVRLPRLKGAAQASPDLESPPASVSAAQDGFGAAAEDGLRMLAAIETMDSLEPDFFDDPVGEASVTIIERSPFDAAEPRDTPQLQGAARRQASASDSGSGDRPAYLGPVEEAVVEIFEGPGPAPAAVGPTRRQKSRPVGRRFFKALTGGDGG